jgi:small conductance mechanosensitive channel
MLDALHQGGVEIVSPTFMNTRSIPDGKLFIPMEVKKEKAEKEPAEKPSAEEMAFDKAEEAESLEKLQFTHESLNKEIDEAKQRLEKAKNDAEKDGIETQISHMEMRRERLADLIKKRQEQEKN